MNNGNIEFSSVRITKALHEAVKGVVEIEGERTEEDFIHWALSFMVGRIIHSDFEVVRLSGNSVDEDVESLKRYFSMKKDGKNVVLGMGGSSENFGVIAKAMEKVSDEWDEWPDSSSRFDLLFKNIKYEDELNLIKHDKLLELTAEKITKEEYDKFLEEEERYRNDKGYLESEIPFGFTTRFYQSLIDPSLFSLSEHFLSFVSIIESGNYTIRDVVLFILLYEALKKDAKRRVSVFLGEERIEQINQVFKQLPKKKILKIIDEGLERFDDKVEDREEDGEEDGNRSEDEV